MRVRVDKGVRGLDDFVVHRRFEGHNLNGWRRLRKWPRDTQTCPEVSLAGCMPRCASFDPCSLSLMSAVRTNANRAAARKKKFSPYARVV